MLPPGNAADNAVSHEELEVPMSPSTVQQRPLPGSHETFHNGDGDKADDAIITNLEYASEPEYITGVKLVLVVAGVALGCFLMLVDTMVISTVSLPAATLRRTSSHSFLSGYSSHHR